jgi:hypothetical protein
MPIRINLLAEQQALEEMRRRDPVKRAIWVAVLLVALFAVWIGLTQLRVMRAGVALRAEEAALANVEKEAKTVQADRTQTIEIERKLDALHELAVNRFLLAPPLNAIQQCMVTNIQVTRIRSDQSYALTEAIRPKPGAAIKPKPATSTERIAIHIQAQDFGQPAGQYSAFIDTISRFPYFKENLASPNGVRLVDPPTPQGEPGRRSSVVFSIECRYPEKVR